MQRIVFVSIVRDMLVKQHPELFCLTRLNSWTSNKRHGLLSTSALLDLFEYKGAERKAMKCCRLRNSIVISHLDLGCAVVRDQKLIDEHRLLGKTAGGSPVLRDRLALCDWYKLLNSKDFFWLHRNCHDRLLGAVPNRNKWRTILIIDTKILLNTWLNCVLLSPINSGKTKLNLQPGGMNVRSQRIHQIIERLSTFPHKAPR